MYCCGALSAYDSSKPVVLIIGAGFGGLSTAKQLIENGGTKENNVIMVDSKDYFTIGGMWQFVWNSRFTMDQVRWPLAKADLPGVNVMKKTSVLKWVPNEKKVVFQNGKELKYHSVVLACGVIADPSTIPGIEDHVNICSESHVARQKQEIIDLVEKAKTEKVVFCLSITVNPYKCPPAPYELIFLVDEYLKNAGVRDNARVVVTCPVDWTMPPNTKPVFMKAFQEKNIEFIPFKELEKVQGNTIFFKDDDSEPFEFTTLWTVWPIRTPDFVAESGLELNAKGTVTVDDKVSNTISGHDNSYVIGDACRVPFGKAGIPKAGEFAWQMGVSVADAIVGDIKPAVRSGKCTAEAGYGKGFILTPNFSDICNDPENGKPKVGIEESIEGSMEKIQWANSYLEKIFGNKVAPLQL